MFSIHVAQSVLKPVSTLANKKKNQPDEPLGKLLSDSTIARYIALQTLYEVDIANHAPLVVLKRHFKTLGSDNRSARFAQLLVTGVIEHREMLDTVIEGRASEFPVDLLAFIDRNIMRMAIFEFGVWGGTPVGVAIDEAVDLAKEFAAEGAPNFINGVLRSISIDKDLLKSLERPVVGDSDHDQN